MMRRRLLLKDLRSVAQEVSGAAVEQEEEPPPHVCSPPSQMPPTNKLRAIGRIYLKCLWFFRETKAICGGD